MAIGRISGPMLYSNLDRQSANLTVDSSLVMFDVVNRRLGINTIYPGYALDVSGNAHMGNLYVQGNTITTDSGYRLNLGSISNIVITGGSANYVLFTDGAGNLNFGEINTFPEIAGITANVTAANAAIVTANTAVVGYINTLESIQTANITAANSAITSLQTFNANLTGNTYNGNIRAANVIITNNVLWANGVSALTSAYGNTQVSAYLPTYSGNIAAGNVLTNALLYANGVPYSFGSTSTYSNANVVSFMSHFGSNSITTTGNITANIVTDIIYPNQSNVTVFYSNTAIGLPSGNTANRPSPAAGYLRYNADNSAIEYGNGNLWIPVTNSVVDQQITPDGTSVTYTLTQSATAAGVIITMNGVVQIPNVAYTVSGNQLTFTEVPLVTDSVDVRFLGALVSINNTLADNLTIAGNLTVNSKISALGNIALTGNNTVTGGKLQTVPVLITSATTIGAAYMGGVLEVGGTLPYTVSLPNPTLYSGQITLWLNASGTLTLTTPAGVIYVTYSGTTTGTGTATVTLANNNTSLFTLIADGSNWAIWGVKTA